MFTVTKLPSILLPPESSMYLNDFTLSYSTADNPVIDLRDTLMKISLNTTVSRVPIH